MVTEEDGKDEVAQEAGKDEMAQEEGRDGDSSAPVPLLALDAAALISWFASVLASRAWVDMGLLADPIKGEIAKDMTSARLAIDAYEGLVDCLRRRGGDEGEVRQFDAVLTDLRLNFVRQAGGD